MTISGLRSRVAGAVAGAGALSLLLGAAALIAAPAASADQAATAGKPGNPPGNNGTVKIEGVELQSKQPDNNPHQGCSFLVEFYNYDEGDLHAEVTFEDQAPTADGGLQVVSGQQKLFIGGDPAGGGRDLDAKETYTLKFTGEPHPKQGYHVKLTVNAEGSIGNDVKHKVFWVEGCDLTTPPSTPPTTAPTTPPATPSVPPTTPPTLTPSATPPVTSPTETPEETPTGTPSATPPAETPQETPTADTPAPSATPSSPVTGTNGVPGPSGSDTPGEAVPTEVDAGLAGGTDGENGAGGNNPLGLLGTVLLAAGGVLLATGAAVALRKRGTHSI